MRGEVQRPRPRRLIISVYTIVSEERLTVINLYDRLFQRCKGLVHGEAFTILVIRREIRYPPGFVRPSDLVFPRVEAVLEMQDMNIRPCVAGLLLRARQSTTYHSLLFAAARRRTLAKSNNRRVSRKSEYATPLCPSCGLCM
jgi:hypothetical protein